MAKPPSQRKPEVQEEPEDNTPAKRKMKVLTHGAVFNDEPHAEGDHVELTDEEINSHRERGVALGEPDPDAEVGSSISDAKAED